MGRRRRKRKGKAAPDARARGPAPRVHVRVAVLDNDFRAATALVRPAILYADKVTIYSPAASVLDATRNLRNLTDRRQQLDAMVDLFDKVPALATQYGFDPKYPRLLKELASRDRRAVRRAARTRDEETKVDEAYEILDEFGSNWDKEIPKALDQVRSGLGAGELLDALDAGYLRVATLGPTSKADFVAASVRSWIEDRDDEAVGQSVADFTARLIEIVSERRSFPLLDDASASLARALEQEGARIRPQAMRRGAEATSAVSFMGFLPSFRHLHISEIIDLRDRLSGPLIHFRGALARLSREFESRPIDEGFDAELEDAWRQQVEPALAEIRETLADHGLLREVASVAMGDPRRLMYEAGGVIAAGNGAVATFPHLMTAGLAAGVTLADTAGRALAKRIEAQREVRKNAFFFLHGVEVEGSRRSKRRIGRRWGLRRR